MRNGNVMDMAPSPEQFNMVNMSLHQQSNTTNDPPPSYSEVMNGWTDLVPEPPASQKRPAKLLQLCSRHRQVRL